MLRITVGALELLNIHNAQVNPSYRSQTIPGLSNSVLKSQQLLMIRSFPLLLSVNASHFVFGCERDSIV